MQLDLHIHTKHSFDSATPPGRVVRAAIRQGLDAIAVTDHDSIDGAVEAERLAAGRILVIVGEEITTRAGDVIGLFLREPIREEDPAEAVRAIHAQGGLAILPHPFAKNLTIDRSVAEKLDGCEGYNARYSKIRRLRSEQGDPRVQHFAAQYGLTLLASSDAHTAREVGRARTVLPEARPADLKEAIRRGPTVLEGWSPGPGRRALAHAWEAVLELADPIPEARLWPKS